MKETEPKRIGIGFINRIAASSIGITLKELVKDVVDDNELTKKEKELLLNVEETDQKLKARLSKNSMNGFSNKYNNFEKNRKLDYEEVIQNEDQKPSKKTNEEISLEK